MTNTNSTLKTCPDLRAPFIDVMSKSLDGAKERLASLIPGKLLPVVWVPNDRQMRELIRTQGQVTFPFLALQATAVADQDSGLSAKNLQREGALTGLDPNLDYYARIHCIPVAVQVKVNFVAQSQTDSIDFISAWKWADKSGGLRFELAFDPQPFFLTINLDLDADLTIPELAEEDVGEYFEYETSLTVRTYIAKMTRVPVAKRVRIEVGVAATQTEGGLQSPTVPTFQLTYRLPKEDQNIYSD